MQAQRKMGDGSINMGDAARQARQVADNPAMLNQMKQQQVRHPGTRAPGHPGTVDLPSALIFHAVPRRRCLR